MTSLSKTDFAKTTLASFCSAIELPAELADLGLPNENQPSRPRLQQPTHAGLLDRRGLELQLHCELEFSRVVIG